MTQDEVTIAVHAEKLREINRRLESAERKIWGAILGVLGITITIITKTLEAGIQ